MSFDSRLESVLIIESEQGMRTLISNYIKGFGAAPVEVASPGDEALKLIDNKVFDLAIIDWKSKQPSGPELYEIIRDHPLNSDIFIIFISGQVTKDDILHTIKDPKATFIVKPFTEDVLFKAVNAFYKGKLRNPSAWPGRVSIHKGEARQGGLDLSIHKSDRGAGPSSYLDQGEGLDPGFKSTESKDERPSGHDLLVHGKPSEGFEFKDQDDRGQPFEAIEAREASSLDYTFAKAKASGPERSIGQEQGVASQGHVMSWDEDDYESRSAKPPAREEAVAGSEASIAREKGQKNPTRDPQRTAPGNDDKKAKEPGREQGVAANRKTVGLEEGQKKPRRDPQRTSAGNDAAQHSPGSESGVANQARPIGKELGKAAPARDKSSQAQSNPLAARERQSQGLPNSARSRAIETDPLIYDIDDDQDASLTYSKKSISQGAALNYSVDKRIRALNRRRSQVSLDVLIIDDDSKLTNLMQNHLRNVRSDFVEVCHDGIEGWAAAKSYHYSLIVMDWRSKGLNGLALYNRLRMRPETRKTPIIILTGSMGKNNFRIIEDNTCTMVLEKPFELEVFEKAVESICQTHHADIQIHELACQVIDQQNGDRKKIYENLKTVTAKLAAKFEFMLAAGQYLIHLKEFKLAQKILEAAARIEPHDVRLMTEMAKVHLRLDHPTKSLKLLTEANHFSPGNIERLCLMGEAGLDLFQTDKAQEYFKRALQIDEDNVKAKQGSVVTGNLAEYLKTVEDSRPLQAQFASTLNLIGITYIKSNQIENGIEQYHCAMAFIHDRPTTARIQFNLGLAYFRSGDKKLALEWLNESKKNSDSSFTKPRIWYEKIESGSLEIQELMDNKPAGLEWDSEEFVDSLADSLQQMMENTEYEES